MLMAQRSSKKSPVRDSQLRSYEHLHGLHFPEVSESCIDLLIGAGAMQVHSVVDARVVSRRGQPTAFKTGVGWVLMGPDEQMPSNKDCYLCLSCLRLLPLLILLRRWEA